MIHITIITNTFKYQLVYHEPSGDALGKPLGGVVIDDALDTLNDALGEALNDTLGEALNDTLGEAEASIYEYYITFIGIYFVNGLYHRQFICRDTSQKVSVV